MATPTTKKTTEYNINSTNIDAWWKSRQRADAKEWVRVSAELGEWVRELARRDDLIAVVEPGSGKGAPAVFLPESGTVEVNPDICAEGLNPADIRMDTEVGRLASPSFAGAGGHEGGHGAYSKWPIDQNPKKRAVVQAALLLEESAMEGDLVRDNPEVRVLLRATFDKIVNQSKEPIETPAGAAHMAALAHGRVDAGVLHYSEVEPMIDVCKGILGDRYEQLRQVWLDVQRIGVRDDAAVMEAHGQRWLDILGDDAPGAGGEGGEIVVFICGGEPGEDGDGDGEGEGILKQIAEAISEAAEKEAKGQVDSARNRDEAADRKRDADDHKKDEQSADQVFSPPIMIAHGSGSGREGIASQRNPTAAEHGQANQLAAALAKAQYRDRSTTIVASQVPPGHLRASQAMRRSAERAMGMVPTAQPWKQKVRKHVDQPPIRVGIACDISGSMRSATRSVASAAWVVAQAVHRNEGDSATVAYGNGVHAVVKPGEQPQTVRDFNANGGTENWTGAMRSLNGALQLDRSSGVRLMVFISDGHYTARQKQEGEVMVKKLMASGVKVLWVGFDGQTGSYGDQVPDGAEYVQLTSPDRMGAVIGAAMVRLLTKA